MLYESRGGRPGLCLCGRKTTSEEEVCLARLCCLRFIFKRLCYAQNNAYLVFTLCCGTRLPAFCRRLQTYVCMDTTQDNFDLMSAFTRSLHSVQFCSRWASRRSETPILLCSPPRFSFRAQSSVHPVSPSELRAQSTPFLLQSSELRSCVKVEVAVLDSHL